MATHDNQHREHPSTYFVQDRSNQEELARLQILGQMFTTGMGGVLSEQPDPTIFRRVLDVGCLTGEWLIQTAKTYPGISLLVGVDISNKMVKYAQAQAEAQQISDRVQFVQMDPLRMLEFPHNYFDLVNQRFAVSYLRAWDWPKLLSEFQRVTRRGGVIRLTETNFMVETTSPALTRLHQILLQALYRAGNHFTPDGDGVISQLARLLHQHGAQNVQTHTRTLQFRSGTIEGQHFYEEKKLFFRTILPFLRKWTRVPDDYEMIRQQMVVEMQQPDFWATWNLLTAWGTKSIRDSSQTPVCD